MEPGNAKVLELRGESLRLFLAIATPVSLLLVLLYTYIGIPLLAAAASGYFVLNAWLWVRTRSRTLEAGRAANVFLVATLAMLLLGLATGTETVDNKPWQILFPIVAFVVAGARAGLGWSAAWLAGALGVLALRWPVYEPDSVLILLVAHVTAALALYVFMRRNEFNIRTISRLSHTDSLTNTYNRQLFDQLSTNEVNRAKRAEEPLAVYMIDIDHFKQYNDRYGHLAGDHALASVARVIRRSARRASDLVFRYGGEEFCVVSSGLAPDDASRLAHTIIDGVRELGIEHADAESRQLTVSIGLAYRECLDGLSAGALLRDADEALYRAKTRGRDRLMLHAAAIDKLELASVGA